MGGRPHPIVIMTQLRLVVVMLAATITMKPFPTTTPPPIRQARLIFCDSTIHRRNDATSCPLESRTLILSSLATTTATTETCQGTDSNWHPSNTASQPPTGGLCCRKRAVHRQPTTSTRHQPTPANIMTNRDESLTPNDDAIFHKDEKE